MCTKYITCSPNACQYIERSLNLTDANLFDDPAHVLKWPNTYVLTIVTNGSGFNIERKQTFADFCNDKITGHEINQLDHLEKINKIKETPFLFRFIIDPNKELSDTAFRELPQNLAFIPLEHKTREMFDHFSKEYKSSFLTIDTESNSCASYYVEEYYLQLMFDEKSAIKLVSIMPTLLKFIDAEHQTYEVQKAAANAGCGNASYYCNPNEEILTIIHTRQDQCVVM